MVTAKRLDSLIHGLNGQARKVYEATPIGESWEVLRIAREIRRVHSTGPALDVLQGCLSALRDSGLIKEPVRGQFIRSQVPSYTPPKQPDPEAQMAAPTPQQPAPAATTLQVKTAQRGRSPLLDRFGAMAEEARAMAGRLTALANQLEAAAIDVDDAIKEASTGNERLRQLRELLIQE